MGKRTYYSFEKRQKELKKQKKKEAKAELKRYRKEARLAGMELEAWLEQEGLEMPEGVKASDDEDLSGLGIEPGAGVTNAEGDSASGDDDDTRRDEDDR